MYQQRSRRTFLLPHGWAGLKEPSYFLSGIWAGAVSFSFSGETVTQRHPAGDAAPISLTFARRSGYLSNPGNSARQIGTVFMRSPLVRGLWHCVLCKIRFRGAYISKESTKSGQKLKNK